MILPIAASIFGLALGQPLTLPECVRDDGVLRSYAVEQPVMCQQIYKEYQPKPWQEQFIIFPHSQVPEILSSTTIGTRLKDDKLIGVEFDTRGVDDQSSILDALTKKFGPPRTAVRLPIATATGGKFTSLVAEWALPDAFVRYTSATTRIDRGRVLVLDPTGKKMQDDLDSAEAKARIPL